MIVQRRCHVQEEKFDSEQCVKAKFTAFIFHHRMSALSRNDPYNENAMCETHVPYLGNKKEGSRISQRIDCHGHCGARLDTCENNIIALPSLLQRKTTTACYLPDDCFPSHPFNRIIFLAKSPHPSSSHANAQA